MRKYRNLMIMLTLWAYLGIYEGYLALWKEPSGKPDRVFPYSASLFPEEDRKALEKGIHFSSQQELAQLIQDYLS